MDFIVNKISRKKMDAMIQPYQTNLKVLDVGGSRSPDYQKYFSNKTVVDITAGPGVDIVASVYQLPFQDGEFDRVLCMVVLEHLEDPIRAIAEMRRVLKPGGKIIISVPFMFPMHDTPGDYWRFTKFGLQKLFSNGWKIEKIAAETTTEEAFAVMLQRLAYQTKMRFNKVSKFFIFMLARFIAWMPSIITHVYGDIKKTHTESDAFTSSFFLVAEKI